MVCMVSRTGRHLQRYNSGRRLVVGCIPYRYKNKNDEGAVNDLDLEVLVISSQKGQEMMFPKGGWELDESAEDAANRESLEEAGVRGKLESELGEWKFKSRSLGIYHEGHMFPLLVTEELDQWPEKNVRDRKWMSVTKAKEVCKHGWMKEALDILVDRLMYPKHQQQQVDEVPLVF
ncbi:nudix hydrolase 17, mitochondrial [Cornus florida]|uniref:nudix hydrolase 17, mitochondrial n=1 Tax=Cornus florida TaxID=4283 RepID=UPI0028A009C2|nr:nudix hydrolase 17, mitochondrial [Cornus florida]